MLDSRSGEEDYAERGLSPPILEELSGVLSILPTLQPGASDSTLTKIAATYWTFASKRSLENRVGATYRINSLYVYHKAWQYI